MPGLPKHHIEVKVTTHYVDSQSIPDANRYVFTYTVSITNSGAAPARLVSRHWVITDANEKVMEVRGPGVVGEQPYLAPGATFEYTSGTVLETPVGSMKGSYQMIDDDGVEFDADIHPFVLSMPRTLH
jgi:ApaG protein